LIPPAAIPFTNPARIPVSVTATSRFECADHTSGFVVPAQWRNRKLGHSRIYFKLKMN
jgi:hypothetical protein